MTRKSPPPIRSDADALLAAVWAAPHDDLPRLVYADWLDENGDADRAEFVRLQVERAQVENGGGEVSDEARRREGELWDEHRGDWPSARTPDSAARHAGSDFCVRGFAAPLLKLTSADAGRTGVRSGRVRAGWAKPGALAALLRSQPVRDADELTLKPSRAWGADDFAALSGPDRPDHLTALALEGWGGPELSGWAARLDLARLRRLKLPYAQGGAPLVIALAASPAAGRLVRLDLTTVALNVTALRLLGEARGFARLRSLGLGDGTYTGRGLSAFLGSPVGAGLARLDLAGKLFEVADTPLPNLRELRLNPSAAISAEDWRALAESPHLAGLRELHAHPNSGRLDARVLKAAFGERLRPAHLWQKVLPPPPDVGGAGS